MEWYSALLILVGALLALLATGLPVAFGFMTVVMAGLWIWVGGLNGLSLLVSSVASSVPSFVLVPVPMFLLMGGLFFNSGLSAKVIDAVDLWLGRVPARLTVLALGAGTFISVASGSSIASTAMLGSSLLPEMERRGYDRRFAMGSIMLGGLMDSLIPPSILMVVAASLLRVSAGHLLIAGIIPGLILGALALVYMLVRVRLKPSLAPAFEVSRVPLRQKIAASGVLVWTGLVVLFVIGSILIGLASPSEAAAFGAVAMFFVALFAGKLDRRVLMLTGLGTVRTTTMVLFIFAWAKAFSELLAFSGSTRGLAAFATWLDFPPLGMLLAMIAVILVLGCFMEGFSILAITAPVFLPIAVALKWDLVWFALIMCVGIEVGFLTPPFGLLLFVMKGVAPRATSADVIWAAVPYVVMVLMTMALVIVFPPLATWLPRLWQ